MLLELHMLQNFAPSCLNRDDTNSPKDCEFGGFRRARISSQCLKRAIRKAFQDRQLLPPEALAFRSKRVVDELANQLAGRGRDREASLAAAQAVLEGAGLSLDDGKTQYLLFLGNDQAAALADLIDANWDVVAALQEKGGAEGAEGKKGKGAKKEAKSKFPSELESAVEAALQGSRAVDLALFGRMLADLKAMNVDAACQVAHAISTNRMNLEFDYYTAVDDLMPEDESGAGMIGTVEFNSACFYRYANVSLPQLERNLGGDRELARQAVRAFLSASVEAIPTGRQNGMAAHNPPSLILAVVRRQGFWNLANAFVRPIRPAAESSLIDSSIAALDRYWGELTSLYGEAEIAGAKVCRLGDGELSALAPYRVGRLSELVDGTMDLLAGEALP
ncbi:MAG: type I-E CRISPR-associated protein Cas7/Cse4/CasC [Thermoanaerobaculia bacterium]|nr:type I-E CRISPR-associated protein Cas7/Cse4/CasC [Thermoanaerobaculia bacterium]